MSEAVRTKQREEVLRKARGGLSYEAIYDRAYANGQSDELESALSAQEEGTPDAQIKHMVNRFLQWRLPENFNPDGGISFKKAINEQRPTWPQKNEPIGTNLLDATQAEAMVRYMLEGIESSHAPEGRDERAKGWRLCDFCGSQVYENPSSPDAAQSVKNHVCLAKLEFLRTKLPAPEGITDRAIEYGEYLACAAESYLNELNRYDMACAKMLDVEVPNSDSLSDHHQALRVAIYEFRKRFSRNNVTATR